VIAAVPPFSLDAPVFRFRAIAALAGRAPLGGEREMALATLMAARLAEGMLPATALSTAARQSRATGARVWFSTLTLPAATRLPLARLVEATEGENPSAVAEALATFAGVAASMLDPASRAEISDLLAALGAL
jgi:hypothetical protein